MFIYPGPFSWSITLLHTSNYIMLWQRPFKKVSPEPSPLSLLVIRFLDRLRSLSSPLIVQIRVLLDGLKA